MKSCKELPKSSQPATGVFKELYDRLGEDGSEIISIHMTGGMSGTVKSAQSSRRNDRFECDCYRFDVHFTCINISSVEAAQMASEEKRVKEIVEHLKDVRKQTTLFVVVDTFDNLVKGGRIGKGKAMIGSLLNIKPIATLQDGVYTPVQKHEVIDKLYAHFLKRLKKKQQGRLFEVVGISHANGLAMAEPLKKLIEESGIKDVKLTFTTPIISTHTGEGAIGFMYYTE